jgi:hypothetical protein
MPIFTVHCALKNGTDLSTIDMSRCTLMSECSSFSFLTSVNTDQFSLRTQVAVKRRCVDNHILFCMNFHDDTHLIYGWGNIAYPCTEATILDTRLCIRNSDHIYTIRLSANVLRTHRRGGVRSKPCRLPSSLNYLYSVANWYETISLV